MKYTETGIWAIGDSWCEFEGEYDSKEEAIQAAKERYGEEGLIGQCYEQEFEIDDIPWIDWDEMINDGYLLGWNMTDDELDELNRRTKAVVLEFINEKDLQPGEYYVQDVESVDRGEI